MGVPKRGKAAETRILVAYGEEYRAYRGVIAAGIQLLRPYISVASCTPGELGGELERFDPQMVICGVPGIVDPGESVAWVEMPIEPGRPAKVRIGGRRREYTHLLLEGLLEIVDEAEGLLR